MRAGLALYCKSDFEDSLQLDVSIILSERLMYCKWWAGGLRGRCRRLRFSWPAGPLKTSKIDARVMAVSLVDEWRKVLISQRSQFSLSLSNFILCHSKTVKYKHTNLVSLRRSDKQTCLYANLRLRVVLWHNMLSTLAYEYLYRYFPYLLFLSWKHLQPTVVLAIG